VKLLAIIGATTALTCGMAASAAPVARAPMLSFTISPGVSDSGLKPLGGGICLSNKRVTDPKADGGIAWSPDGSRIAVRTMVPRASTGQHRVTVISAEDGRGVAQHRHIDGWLIWSAKDP